MKLHFLNTLSAAVCLIGIGCATASPDIGREALPQQLSGAENAGAGLAPLPNARQPLPNLLTGGKPTPAVLRAAQAAGYRLVVSLLPTGTAAEEVAVRDLEMEFISIPIAGPAGLTEDNARRLAELLRDRGQRPMVLHCASGNRAGALLALAAYYGLGYDRQAAIELGVAAGLTGLRAEVESRLLDSK